MFQTQGLDTLIFVGDAYILCFLFLYVVLTMTLVFDCPPTIDWRHDDYQTE
jgi:hypothetical protein